MSLNDFEQTDGLGPEAMFVVPDATLSTAPGKDHPPQQVVINRLALTRLPVAMRSMGWDTAAALMQRWFDSPAWAMPEDWKKTATQPKPLAISPENCDVNIVKMEWAMRYERCRNAVVEATSLINTLNAVSLLRVHLKAVGWKPGASFELGNVNMSAIQLDAVSQVNFVGFGKSLDVLDDMYGALGKATLKVGVVGLVLSVGDKDTSECRHYFQVTDLGFYIRDNYDFNGFQYLGTWTENRVLTKSEIFSDLAHGQSLVHVGAEPFAAVSNADFRNYRDKTGLGGDFVLYSDILWKKHDQLIDLGDMS